MMTSIRSSISQTCRSLSRRTFCRRRIRISRSAGNGSFLGFARNKKCRMTGITANPAA